MAFGRSVNQVERRADGLVAQRPGPAAGCFPLPLDPEPDDLDEEQLGQPLEHDLRARLAGSRLAGDQLHDAAKILIHASLCAPNVDEPGQAVQQRQVVGIVKMERAAEHQQLGPCAFAADDVAFTLRVVVEMDHAGQGRGWVVEERVRVARREEHDVAVFQPARPGLAFDLEESAAKADDVEGAVLAVRKVIAPGPYQLPA